MNVIVTLTGPSCAGKSTLESMLKKRGFENVISTTTRKPRDGEVNGKSYHFVSVDEFTAMQANDEFVETVCFNGNYYGVTAAEIERVFATGKPVVVVVEPHGQRQVAQFAKKRGWKLFGVFVNNPPEVIAARFLERFANDLMRETQIGSDKQVKAYASRLALMMREEQGWIADAEMDAFASIPSYDMLLDEFNETNSSDVINTITNLTNVKEAA